MLRIVGENDSGIKGFWTKKAFVSEAGLGQHLISACSGFDETSQQSALAVPEWQGGASLASIIAWQRPCEAIKELMTIIVKNDLFSPCLILKEYHIKTVLFRSPPLDALSRHSRKLPWLLLYSSKRCQDPRSNPAKRTAQRL